MKNCETCKYEPDWTVKSKKTLTETVHFFAGECKTGKGLIVKASGIFHVNGSYGIEALFGMIDCKLYVRKPELVRSEILGSLCVWKRVDGHNTPGCINDHNQRVHKKSSAERFSICPFCGKKLEFSSFDKDNLKHVTLD